MVTLMLMRRMTEYAQVVQNRGWSNQLPVRSIRGSSFTLLGTGDIGTTFAQKVKALGGGKIVGLNRSGRCPDPVYDSVLPISRLDEALPHAHALVMALPARRRPWGSSPESGSPCCPKTLLSSMWAGAPPLTRTPSLTR